MPFKTADLCDKYSDELQIAEPIFGDFGGTLRFSGPISTVKLFEDNSLVRKAFEEPGEGRVLVIDGGASMRCALIGDMLGEIAVNNGWAGAVVYGCIRDSVEIGELELGVKAMGTCPLKSQKRNEGQRDVPLRFAGVKFVPGNYLYGDEDGIIIATRSLL